MPVPATRRRVALPTRGIEVQVLDWGGCGPPALLSHANGFCAALWDAVARPLRSRFRVLAFDARGHGSSSKPPPPEPYAWRAFIDDLLDLAALLLRELRAPSLGLAVGHSFGGTVTLAAASERPELFERIALVDPVVPPPMALDDSTPQESNAFAQRALRRKAVWPSRDEARGSWRSRAMFRDWDPGAFDLYLEEALRDRPDGRVELSCPPEIEAAIFAARGRPDPLKCAEGLAQPALLLRAGRGDFPRELHERVARAAPRMSLIEIDAGHLLPMIAPDELARHLLRFGLSPLGRSAGDHG